MSEYRYWRNWPSNVVMAVGVVLLLFSPIVLWAGVSMISAPAVQGFPGPPWEVYVMVSLAAGVVMGLGAIALGVGFIVGESTASKQSTMPADRGQGQVPPDPLSTGS